MEPICRICVSSKWLVFKLLMRPSLAGFERPLTPLGVTDTSGDSLVGGPLHLPGTDPVFAILPKGRGNGGLVSGPELEAPHFRAVSQQLLNRARTAVAGDMAGDTEALWFPLLLLSMAGVSGVVNVHPNVTDNVGVARVELIKDGVLYATSLSSPFDTSYDSSQDGPGFHTLQLRAYDAAGNVGLSNLIAVKVIQTVVPAPPTVSFLNPVNGANVTHSQTVSIAAFSAVGIASVSLRVDGVSFGTKAAPPYDFAWNTSSLANGIHYLLATAVDTTGQTSLSEIRVTSHNLDKVKPRVSITSPRPKTAIGPNIITVAVNVTDNTRVALVALMVDGRVVTQSTTTPFDLNWNAAKVKVGRHSLQAKAFDIFNNSGLSQKVAIHRVNVAKASVSRSAEKIAVTLLKRFNLDDTKRGSVRRNRLPAVQG